MSNWLGSQQLTATQLIQQPVEGWSYVPQKSIKLNYMLNIWQGLGANNFLRSNDSNHSAMQSKAAPKGFVQQRNCPPWLIFRALPDGHLRQLVQGLGTRGFSRKKSVNDPNQRPGGPKDLLSGISTIRSSDPRQLHYHRPCFRNTPPGQSVTW